MSTFRLDHLFAPRSVVLAGASPRTHSVGRTILQNLRSGGFDGTIRLVNPNYTEIDGVAAVKSIAYLPDVPDLLIVAVPPSAVPTALASADDAAMSVIDVVRAHQNRFFPSKPVFAAWV